MKRFHFALATLALAFVASSASANVIWNWNNGGGGESGTFVTDGMAATGSLAAGSYTLLDFTLDMENETDLAVGSITGGQFSIAQPAATIEWDGAMITSLTQDNGADTSGFLINLVNPTGMLTGLAFTPTVVVFNGLGKFNMVQIAPSLIPVAPSLALLAIAGMGLARRRA